MTLRVNHDVIELNVAMGRVAVGVEILQGQHEFCGIELRRMQIYPQADT